VEIAPSFRDADLETLFDPVSALAARGTIGGTAPDAVRHQLKALFSR
jgi:hypothetical protein